MLRIACSPSFEDVIHSQCGLTLLKFLWNPAKLIISLKIYNPREPASKTTIMIVKKIHMVLRIIRCIPHFILIHVENLLLHQTQNYISISFDINLRQSLYKGTLEFLIWTPMKNQFSPSRSVSTSPDLQCIFSISLFNFALVSFRGLEFKF